MTQVESPVAEEAASEKPSGLNAAGDGASASWVAKQEVPEFQFTATEMPDVLRELYWDTPPERLPARIGTAMQKIRAFQAKQRQKGVV